MVKNKKGWMRIAEAFIAIILLGSVSLIVLQKGNNMDNSKEIIKLQSNILNEISHDQYIRNELLSGNTTKAESYIKNTLPYWINFSARVCQPLQACAICTGSCDLKTLADKEIYASEIIITSNLTYFNSSNIAKFKLFMWEI